MSTTKLYEANRHVYKVNNRSQSLSCRGKCGGHWRCVHGSSPTRNAMVVSQQEAILTTETGTCRVARKERTIYHCSNHEQCKDEAIGAETAEKGTLKKINVQDFSNNVTTANDDEVCLCCQSDEDIPTLDLAACADWFEGFPELQLQVFHHELNKKRMRHHHCCCHHQHTCSQNSDDYLRELVCPLYNDLLTPTQKDALKGTDSRLLLSTKPEQTGLQGDVDRKQITELEKEYIKRFLKNNEALKDTLIPVQEKHSTLYLEPGDYDKCFCLDCDEYTPNLFPYTSMGPKLVTSNAPKTVEVPCGVRVSGHVKLSRPDQDYSVCPQHSSHGIGIVNMNSSLSSRNLAAAWMPDDTSEEYERIVVDQKHGKIVVDTPCEGNLHPIIPTEKGYCIPVGCTNSSRCGCPYCEASATPRRFIYIEIPEDQDMDNDTPLDTQSEDDPYEVKDNNIEKKSKTKSKKDKSDTKNHKRYRFWKKKNKTSPVPSDELICTKIDSEDTTKLADKKSETISLKDTDSKPSTNTDSKPPTNTDSKLPTITDSKPPTITDSKLSNNTEFKAPNNVDSKPGDNCNSDCAKIGKSDCLTYPCNGFDKTCKDAMTLTANLFNDCKTTQTKEKAVGNKHSQVHLRKKKKIYKKETDSKSDIVSKKEEQSDSSLPICNEESSGKENDKDKLATESEPGKVDRGQTEEICCRCKSEPCSCKKEARGCLKKSSPCPKKESTYYRKEPCGCNKKSCGGDKGSGGRQKECGCGKKGSCGCDKRGSSRFYSEESSDCKQNTCGCSEQESSECDRRQACGCCNNESSDSDNEQRCGCGKQKSSGCGKQKSCGGCNNDCSDSDDEQPCGCGKQKSSGCGKQKSCGCCNNESSDSDDEQPCGCGKQKSSGCGKPKSRGCGEQKPCGYSKKKSCDFGGQKSCGCGKQKSCGCGEQKSCSFDEEKCQCYGKKESSDSDRTEPCGCGSQKPCSCDKQEPCGCGKQNSCGEEPCGCSKKKPCPSCKRQACSCKNDTSNFGNEIPCCDQKPYNACEPSCNAGPCSYCKLTPCCCNPEPCCYCKQAPCCCNPKPCCFCQKCPCCCESAPCCRCKQMPCCCTQFPCCCEQSPCCYCNQSPCCCKPCCFCNQAPCCCKLNPCCYCKQVPCCCEVQPCCCCKQNPCCCKPQLCSCCNENPCCCKPQPCSCCNKCPCCCTPSCKTECCDKQKPCYKSCDNGESGCCRSNKGPPCKTVSNEDIRKACFEQYCYWKQMCNKCRKQKPPGPCPLCGDSECNRCSCCCGRKCCCGGCCGCDCGGCYDCCGGEYPQYNDCKGDAKCDFDSQTDVENVSEANSAGDDSNKSAVVPKWDEKESSVKPPDTSESDVIKCPCKRKNSVLMRNDEESLTSNPISEPESQKSEDEYRLTSEESTINHEDSKDTYVNKDESDSDKSDQTKDVKEVESLPSSSESNDSVASRNSAITVTITISKDDATSDESDCCCTGARRGCRSIQCCTSSTLVKRELHNSRTQWPCEVPTKKFDGSCFVDDVCLNEWRPLCLIRPVWQQPNFCPLYAPMQFAGKETDLAAEYGPIVRNGSGSKFGLSAINEDTISENSDSDDSDCSDKVKKTNPPIKT